MKYFLDTEFIEDGRTIDLISIGMVSEDGRSIYRQNADASFALAGDFVARNVFPHLLHFDMGKRDRTCSIRTSDSDMSMKDVHKRCTDPLCPWRSRSTIRTDLLDFIWPVGDAPLRQLAPHPTPIFFGYYADYDWVAFCQLWGRMVDLPPEFPKYCLDIKQMAVDIGDPELPKQDTGEHHALHDAQWNRDVYLWLMNRS